MSSLYGLCSVFMALIVVVWLLIIFLPIASLFYRFHQIRSSVYPRGAASH